MKEINQYSTWKRKNIRYTLLERGWLVQEMTDREGLYTLIRAPILKKTCRNDSLAPGESD